MVLTEEEYEVLKVKEKEKHWLETCTSIWKNAKIDAQKETAEKILTALYDACKENTHWQTIVDFTIIENFARQFNVEIKE